jgi:chemotaxis family two-component system response regulator Rcp1
MSPKELSPIVEILLVEDNPGDVRLTWEALKTCKIPSNLRTVGDGLEAMAYLRNEGEYRDAPEPDLILLDLNLPRKDGREVLAEIKQDPELRRIPVIVMTTSAAEPDVLKSYELHANCYVTKPPDFAQLVAVVAAIEEFWLTVAKLPPKRETKRGQSNARKPDPSSVD